MNAVSSTTEQTTYRCDACGWDSSSDREFSDHEFGGYCPRCRLILPEETLGRRFAGFSDEELEEMYRQLTEGALRMPPVRDRLRHEILAEQQLRREQQG